MILEIAILSVRAGEATDFESAFQRAQQIIASMPGYLSHELLQCLEVENRYVLLVRWRALEDHTEGFRKSDEYQEWKRLLHHFYDPFPTVEHYVAVAALQEKRTGLASNRLARECSKLNKAKEQSLADEGLSSELAAWPEY
jgi:heme-degrading monooxygenase HmoA